MATQTPNLSLTKPAGTDYVRIGDFNDNADKLDAAIGNPTQLQTAEKTNLVLAINEAALSGGENTPYIDATTKHWMKWDVATLRYVDTGVIAEGEHVHIKWSADIPTSDTHLKDTPDAYIGMYAGPEDAAPATYTAYAWYKYKGEQGPAGTGNNWHEGTAITGTSATPTAYATGIAKAQIGDMYINKGVLPDTGRVYRCVSGGDDGSALWIYSMLLRGADGAGSGDMSKSVYDPGGKAADAFDMDNMVEGATQKIMTTNERTKLTGIAENANNYTHPASHPASMITQDATYRFVTDVEKGTWNAKQEAITAVGILNGNGTSVGAATAGTDYALPPVEISKTLTAAGWADRQQDIADTAIKATSPGDLRIAQSATDAEAEAWGKAMPRVVVQAAGSITVRAAGTVPTIDIPVILEVRGRYR